jgi:hypothetical protein
MQSRIDSRMGEQIFSLWSLISPEKETTPVESVMQRLEKTLHYKDERAMIFQTFLAKTKHVFKIFEEIGEPKPESAKIRFLLDAVRSTELQPSVQAIRAGMTLDPNVNTFTTAANMIASQGVRG